MDTRTESSRRSAGYHRRPGFGGSDEPGSRPVASAAISAAAGGVITVSDPTSINGLSISIPAGALAANTTITVSELISPPTLGGTPRFLLKGFSVDPDGTQLAVPAQITIPYSVNEFATTQGITLEDFLGLYFVDTATGGLELQSDFSVDKTNHALTGTLPHFSVYEVTNFARLCPPLLPGDQPPLSDVTCPNTYTAVPSSFLPAVLVHGWHSFNPLPGGTMGTESTWGDITRGSLRYLLKQHGLDAWRFDWDSNSTTFEISAANLDSALQCIENHQPENCRVQGASPHLVNLVAHSFGGILVRTYLEDYANNIHYRQDVNRVMTIETPHTGIGGTLSNSIANTCVLLAQVSAITELLLPTPLRHPPQPITCFEATKGFFGAAPGTGVFMNKLNTHSLPPLNPSLIPQYDIIVGERRVCLKTNDLCLLQSDDGLITAAGADLCSLAPVQSDCSGNIVLQEPNPGVPADIGLCHSSYLIGKTCPLNSGNIATTEVNDQGHPLWPKICTFLGGCGAAVRPTITTQPASQTVIAGQTATFTVVATGTAPLSYQWQKNGTEIAGATSASYTTPPTTTLDSGSTFRVVVSNTAGSATSNTATLTVNPVPIAPMITTQPASQTVIAGQTATFTVVATGTAPLSYQWQKNGTNIPGATSASYTTPPTTTADTGSSFAAVVSNIVSSVTSAPATLTVSPPGPHTLTVASTSPNSGAAITVSPADNGGQSSGVTPFARTYDSGTVVTLTAASSAGGNSFSSWTGCDLAPDTVCTVTLTADRTVTATYGPKPGFAYVANQFSGDVSAYKVDAASGALTPLTPIATFTSGLTPNSVAADPAGHCLYVANQQDSIVPVAVFTINASTGALTPGPAPSLSLSDFFPVSIAVNSTGTFAYIANLGGTVSVFAINAVTCGLTRISGSPFAAGILPSALTLDPTGAFLYVTNLNDANISAYTINSSTGALTPIIGSPFPTGAGPTAITVHPMGKFAFATNGFDSTVSVYTLNQSTGALTPILGSPFPTGQAPFSVAVEPLGKFVYIPNSGDNNISAYSFDAAAVAPTPTPIISSPFPTGTSPIFVIADPSGKFLYVANNGSTSVSAFQIDANTGTLTPILPVGFFPAGGGPISMTITALPAH